jgi:hypothetical protein
MVMVFAQMANLVAIVARGGRSDARCQTCQGGKGDDACNRKLPDIHAVFSNVTGNGLLNSDRIRVRSSWRSLASMLPQVWRVARFHREISHHISDARPETGRSS